MFWQFGFRLPYLRSVLKSPVGVRTVKHLFSLLKSVCYSPGRLSQGISYWMSIHDETFLIRSFFSSEVVLNSPVRFVCLGVSLLYFEASLAISSRCMLLLKTDFSDETGRRCSIPVSVWFSCIRIMFLLSEVWTGNRFGFRSFFYLSWIDFSG